MQQCMASAKELMSQAAMRIGKSDADIAPFMKKWCIGKRASTCIKTSSSSSSSKLDVLCYLKAPFKKMSIPRWPSTVLLSPSWTISYVVLSYRDVQMRVCCKCARKQSKYTYTYVYVLVCSCLPMFHHTIDTSVTIWLKDAECSWWHVIMKHDR